MSEPCGYCITCHHILFPEYDKVCPTCGRSFDFGETASYMSEANKDKNTIPAGYNNWLLEVDAYGRCAPSDLAGLRNRIRLIQVAQQEGDDAHDLIEELLDDLNASSTRFNW